MALTFEIIATAARKRLQQLNLPDDYSKRLELEIKEVISQGAEKVWETYFTEKRKFASNPNGLILPWLLKRLEGDADTDPIAARKDPLVLTTRHSVVKAIIEQIGHVPFDLRLDDDKPDIDIDCLPEARDPIKEYAASRYGSNNVASVGTWQSYLFKQAIGDAYKALGLDMQAYDNGNQRGPGQKNVAITMTSKLPDDINEMREGGFGVCKGKIRDESGVEKECGTKHNQLKCPKCESEDTETPTIAKILNDYKELREFIGAHPRHKEVIAIALKLVGKIRNAGKHAGGIIIADRDLFGNVPMLYDPKSKQWVSIWTEGRSTQLSKFGYLKWDMLGLKNIAYIKTCCEMIRDNHGISFGDRLEGWDYSDPENDIAGYYWKDGERIAIALNDKEALELANKSLTDAIFQFDTDLAKRTLSNGVRSFHDLLIFNAMGHPGPMAEIPSYCARRDDRTESWKTTEHKDIVKILGDTCGVIVFQEQLAAIWQRLAGFTGPEAQEARKAVAKKWKDKLKPVRQKWIDGAKKELGESKAIYWWDEIMAPFGRYAFNKCLGKDTLVKDEVAGGIATIEDWYESRDEERLPVLLSDCDGEIRQNECVDIHYNGEQEVFLIEFDDGATEQATLDHQFKCEDGQYHTVQEIFDKGLEVARAMSSSRIAAEV